MRRTRWAAGRNRSRSSGFGMSEQGSSGSVAASTSALSWETTQTPGAGCQPG
ncbi:hypothetical protein BC739_007673 [Kutzneria viridogrisea]|uniref:Uncharacterized protein n=1 Tax=Kutzneria viridogrisea TaxID=47990 RepID=A0ABR6BU77_9PSEU|nr:hypothetical protein [Kutzneria viridogrisea]